MRTIINSYPNWRRLPAFAAITLITVCGLFSTAQAQTGPHCTLPYVQVQEGATPLLPDPNLNYTITSVHMGEPFVNCTTKRLTIVMKVGSLAPAPPPNASWTVDFVAFNNSTPPVAITMFVEYSTTINPAGGFNWGFHDTINDINLSQCLPIPGQPCEVTGTAAADGTITMHFNLTTALVLSGLNGESFGTIGGAGWVPGDILSAIRGHTDVFVGAAGTGFSVANSATAGDGEYFVMGNYQSCANPPTAGLAATPTSGPAPLQVNFTATGTIPAGACGPISSYIFDFGDGGQVTQSTPTVSHTYNNAGTYAARVRVVSPSGTSGNIAEQIITVTSAAPPALTAVVSRKTHGAAGDFDILLPEIGTPNIECRGASGNHTLVYTFVNNLVSVLSASVTTGTGSVASSAIGPNTNQYTVNLTGVTNAQTIIVTVNTAVDSIGASGNVDAIVGILQGDTTNDKFVNSADISQTKAGSGAAVGATNFRRDVTFDGFLNSADISSVKSKSGTALP